MKEFVMVLFFDFFIAENKIARKIKVKVGKIYNGKAEILEGLKEGDRVKPGAYTGPKRKSLEMNFD